MIRTISRTIPIALVLLIAAFAPSLSAQGSLPGVEAQPLSTEADTFYIFGTLPPGDGTTNTCVQDVKGIAGNVPGSQFPYAVNNPSDPCANPETPADGSFFITISETLGRTGSIIIPIVPAIPENVQLRDGEGVSGNLRFSYAPFNPDTLPVVFGGARPTLTLQADGENLTTWDEAPELDPVAAGTPGTEKIFWDLDFAFDPVDIPAGPLYVIVDITNDLEAGEIGMTAGKVTLEVRSDRPGTIVVPFANAPVTEDEDPSADNNTTTGVDNNTTMPDGNATSTDGNDTIETPDGNQTVGADNNSTSVEGEEGFLPGFEVSALLVAGMVAVLAVARMRPRRGPGA